MSTGFDEIAYAFEMLGAGGVKIWRRDPGGTWAEYPEYAATPNGGSIRQLAFWNPVGRSAHHIVLALMDTQHGDSHGQDVIGYAIAHRLTGAPRPEAVIP